MYNEGPYTDFFQGDVIRINLNSVEFQDHAPNPPRNTLFKQVNVKVNDLFAVILSHSCDVALENKDKRTRFVISPLHKVFPQLVKQCNGDLLKCNEDVTEGVPINYFIYQKHSKINDIDCCIDLTNCHSFKICELNIDSKVLELTDEMRENLQKRLFISFLR